MATLYNWQCRDSPAIQIIDSHYYTIRTVDQNTRARKPSEGTLIINTKQEVRAPLLLYLPT
jgi:hypothetical protein